MRVLIDTNVLISAALNPAGVPSMAYQKAASHLRTAVPYVVPPAADENDKARKMPLR